MRDPNPPGREKGRETKIYGQAATPYEKLKETGRLLNQNFLKVGITLESLDQLAYGLSDNRFAAQMRLQEKLLFSKISQINFPRPYGRGIS